MATGSMPTSRSAGGHEIIAFVAGDQRDISHRRKFGFEFFLGMDALGRVGQLLKVLRGRG